MLQLKSAVYALVAIVFCLAPLFEMDLRTIAKHSNAVDRHLRPRHGSWRAAAFIPGVITLFCRSIIGILLVWMIVVDDQPLWLGGIVALFLLLWSARTLRRILTGYREAPDDPAANSER